ncbi:vWA domain-containing protein [Sphaerisporangium sp. B11E5]|uniref:vWA domain-containing protein n=1 Tax=Sphaerisporangium sp. B11E5 TaxID=3153563 RepID=UPI00325EE2EA
MTGTLWRLAAALLGGVVCCAVAGALGAPAAADQDLDTVYAGLDLASTRATYLVLLDASGSVRDRFPEVREQLKALVKAKGPGDEVLVFPFDEKVRRQVLLTRPEDVDRLEVPEGRWTDIGAALDSAVAWLDEHPSPLAAIMLASDNEHDPAPYSRYRPRGTPAWRALAARAAALDDKIRWLRVYSFPFPAGPARGERDRGELRDAQETVLGRVFPRYLMHDPRDAAERQDLAAVKELARRDVARDTLLEAESGRGVTAEWLTAPGALDVMSGRGTARLRLRSTLRYVPVQVSGLTVPVTGPGGFQVAARPDVPGLLLRPGASAELDVTLVWGPPSRELLDRPLRAGHQAVAGARLTTPWSPGLAKLSVRPPPPVAVTPPLRLFPPGEIQVTGTWRPLTIGGLAGTTLAAALFLWMRLRNQWRPKMYGYLSFTYWEFDHDGNPVARRGRTVPLDGRRGPQTVHPLDGDRAADGAGAPAPDGGPAEANGRPAAVVSGRGLLPGTRRLLIAFTRDGTQAEPTSVPYGGTSLIGGVRFTHHEKPDEDTHGR